MGSTTYRSNDIRVGKLIATSITPQVRKVTDALQTLLRQIDGPIPSKGSRAHNELWMALDMAEMAIERIDTELERGIGRP